MKSGKAIVLFSGGQDSAICLAWALQRFELVETVGFNYGQRHAIELKQRGKFMVAFKRDFPQLAQTLGQDHEVDLGVLSALSDTALTRDKEIAMERDGLPNTFVPGRNLLFFTVAATIAYRREAVNLVGGMCETDFSGYPDCRDDTLKALQVCLNLGMATSLCIHTPLMWLSKAETWKLAQTIGGQRFVEIVIEHTHSCYLGDRSKRHDWGYGCGACPACSLRQQGYDLYKQELRSDIHN